MIARHLRKRHPLAREPCASCLSRNLRHYVPTLEPRLGRSKSAALIGRMERCGRGYNRRTSRTVGSACATGALGAKFDHAPGAAIVVAGAGAQIVCKLGDGGGGLQGGRNCADSKREAPRSPRDPRLVRNPFARNAAHLDLLFDSESKSHLGGAAAAAAARQRCAINYTCKLSGRRATGTPRSRARAGRQVPPADANHRRASGELGRLRASERARAHNGGGLLSARRRAKAGAQAQGG